MQTVSSEPFGGGVMEHAALPRLPGGGRSSDRYHKGGWLPVTIQSVAWLSYCKVVPFCPFETVQMLKETALSSSLSQLQENRTLVCERRGALGQLERTSTKIKMGELMQSCYEVPAMLKAVLIMHQLAVGSSHKYAQTANHTTAVYNKLCSKATGGQFSTSSHLSHQPRAAPPPHFSKLKWPPPERRKSPKAPKAIHKNSCKARHQNDDHLR